MFFLFDNRRFEFVNKSNIGKILRRNSQQEINALSRKFDIFIQK
jgi:hypothetical protein